MTAPGLCLPELAAAVGHRLNLRLVSTSGGGRGRELAGPCPLCGGEDRFRVWPDKEPDKGGSWWCRQCGRGGDGIAFAREIGGYSYREACELVGRKLDASAPKRRRYLRPPLSPAAPTSVGAALHPRTCPPPPPEWRFKAAELLAEAYAALQDDPAALERLQATRGITPATAALFGLGLLRPESGRDCCFSSRAKWGLPPANGRKRPDLLWLPRGLVIPCLVPVLPPAALSGVSTTPVADTAPPAAPGEVIRLRIRRPAGDYETGYGSKYFVVPGSSTAPLLRWQAEHLALVVVESELDAILLWQEIGAVAGVLALGSSSARPDPAAAAALESTQSILLAFDNDPAGQSAAKQWSDWFWHAEPLRLPEGVKDPGEYYQAGGDLAAWVIAALPSPLRDLARRRLAAAKAPDLSIQAVSRPEGGQAAQTPENANPGNLDALSPETQPNVEPDPGNLIWEEF